jgi:hypothetical protein
MITRLAPQIVGNVALFYACYRLSLLGWNVMPTSRNARGIDIVAYSPDASQFMGIRVKSFSERAAVPLGKTLDNVPGDRWIIINNACLDPPSTFIMLPEEVRERAHSNGKGDNLTYWLENAAYDQDQFRDKWEDQLALTACVISPRRTSVDSSSLSIAESEPKA